MNSAELILKQVRSKAIQECMYVLDTKRTQLTMLLVDWREKHPEDGETVKSLWSEIGLIDSLYKDIACLDLG